MSDDPVTPKYFDQMISADKEIYRALQTRAHGDLYRKKPNHVKFFVAFLESILQFTENDPLKSRVCGISILDEQQLIVNVRQLQILLGCSRSRLSVQLTKSGFEALSHHGYVSLKDSKVASWSLRKIPNDFVDKIPKSILNHLPQNNLGAQLPETHEEDSDETHKEDVDETESEDETEAPTEDKDEPKTKKSKPKTNKKKSLDDQEFVPEAEATEDTDEEKFEQKHPKKRTNWIQKILQNREQDFSDSQLVYEFSMSDTDTSEEEIPIDEYKGNLSEFCTGRILVPAMNWQTFSSVIGESHEIADITKRLNRAGLIPEQKIRRELSLPELPSSDEIPSPDYLPPIEFPDAQSFEEDFEQRYSVPGWMDQFDF